MRRIIGVLIALALVAGVIAFWPRADTDASQVTGAIGSTTTTSTTPSATSTAAAPATTTSTDDGSHVVETVEEAETILRELWLGWFEGIYNQDEDRIREVVATEAMLNAAVEAFGAEFSSSPRVADILLELELLNATEDCLVVFGTLDVEGFRGPGAIFDSVQVLRFDEGRWRFATSWKHRDDLWEADCESELLPLP